MSKQLVRAAMYRDPYGWRAGTVRVLANALLVLLAYEVVAMVDVAAHLVAGATIPVTPVELVPGVTITVTPVELVPLVAGFLLIRWIFVLPGCCGMRVEPRPGAVFDVGTRVFVPGCDSFIRLECGNFIRGQRGDFILPRGVERERPDGPLLR